MADSNVPITSGTGTNIDTFTQASGDHRQAMVLGDAANAYTATVNSGGALVVVELDPVATGAITTQNLVPAGTATANSAVTSPNLNGAGGLAIQVTGTYTGALSLQATVDGTNWVTLGGVPLVNVNTGVSSGTIATAVQGIFQADVSGFKFVRITGLAAMTGTATVSLQVSATSALVGLDAPLPAGANGIGSVTVTGTPAISGTVTANGGTLSSTPAVTTTTDTGAKTATGNGATVTNASAKGVSLLFNIGTVSGTTPTCVFKVQGSNDTATTWYDIPNAFTAAITATGIYGLVIYPGITPVAGTATTGSVAQVSSVIPNRYRVVWTITGTTPSFTITNVQVQYLI